MTTYVILFVSEIVGMFLILWDGIPIFHHLTRLQQVTSEPDEILLLIAAALIQFSYWKCLRYDPPFALPRQQFVAHIVIFVSRLSFVFPTTVFSFVVYRSLDVLNINLMRWSLMIVVLFSVFCFSRHLERVGNLMNARPHDKRLDVHNEGSPLFGDGVDKVG